MVAENSCTKTMLALELNDPLSEVWPVLKLDTLADNIKIGQGISGELSIDDNSCRMTKGDRYAVVVR